MDQFVVHKCFGPLAMEKRGNSKYQHIVPGVVLSTTSIHCPCRPHLVYPSELPGIVISEQWSA